jgi:predicted metalloprotease
LKFCATTNVSFCGNHKSIASTHDAVTGVGAEGAEVVVVVVVVVATVVVGTDVVDISGGQSSVLLAEGATTLTIASAGSAATINI